MKNNALCIKLANNYALIKLAMMHDELCIMH